MEDLPVRGFCTYTEQDHGYHNTSHNCRCVAVARRRLVRPRTLVLVLVSEFFAERRAAELELHRFLAPGPFAALLAVVRAVAMLNGEPTQ